MKTSSSRRKGRQSNAGVVSELNSAPSGAVRLERIAVAAYYRAEARGFVRGYELDDWLEAKTEVDEMDKNYPCASPARNAAPEIRLPSRAAPSVANAFTYPPVRISGARSRFAAATRIIKMPARPQHLSI